MHACMSGILTRARLRDLSTLLDTAYAHTHGIESNPSQMNHSTFFFFSYSFFSIFFYISGFFKAFFKIAVYSSNEIVDVIPVLGEARRNYCKTERLYHNKYQFR